MFKVTTNVRKENEYISSFKFKLIALKPQTNNIVKKIRGTILNLPGESTWVHTGLQKGRLSSTRRIDSSKTLPSKLLIFIFQQDHYSPVPPIPHNSQFGTFLSLTNSKNRNIIVSTLDRFWPEAFPSLLAQYRKWVSHLHSRERKLVYHLLHYSTNIYCSQSCARHRGYNREHYKNTAHDIYSLIGRH